MSWLAKWLFPDFCTKKDLEASKKSLSDDIARIKLAVSDDEGYTDKNFHILAAKLDQLDTEVKAVQAKSTANRGILAEFGTLARLAVQNYEDLAEERKRNAHFDKKISDIVLRLDEITTQLNSTKINQSQLTQLNSVNSTKLNSTKLNLTSGMTAMTTSSAITDKSVIPDFVPASESKLTQGHYSVLFVLYNLQADLGSRAVSVKTIVKELYGDRSSHSKESFVSRIVRELDASNLVIKGPRGRTTRVYLSKEGISFCKTHVLTRKEANS